MAEVMRKKQEEFTEEITKQMKGKTPFHKLKETVQGSSEEINKKYRH